MGAICAWIRKELRNIIRMIGSKIEAIIENGRCKQKRMKKKKLCNALFTYSEPITMVYTFN